MKKQETLPPPKLAFTKEQVLYIEQAAKMMPYNIDITSAYIYVPHDMLDKAEEHLTVQHLRNKFGFVIQTTIDNSLKNVFDPVLKSSPFKQSEEIQCEVPVKNLPKRGEEWRHAEKNERWYFKSVTDKIFEVSFLETMKPTSKLTASSIESLVNAGILVKVY